MSDNEPRQRTRPDPEESERKSQISSHDEKHDPTAVVSTQSVESESLDGDEALKLVGTLRTEVFTEEYYAKLRRKLDWTIPTICAAVYFTQFLDKNTLSYASIMGLPITGQHYNLVSAAFYIGFLVWEFPTQYIAQRLRIAKYLGVNVCLWGMILMMQAVTPRFGAFFALRFIMGMLESCVAPILILLIGMFYKKDEQARRVSWFYVMNGVTAIFGGFVAYGISFIKSPFAAYRILYLLLGSLAIVVGIIVLLFLPDSPVHARMLTREERIACLERVRNDQGGTENHHFKRYQVWEAITDVRTWLILLTVMTTSIPNGGLSNFTNLIVKSFGYTSKQVLILNTPGGAIGALTTLGCGWYSDKKGERMLPIIFAIVPTIVGSAMLIGLNNSGEKGALLFATYLIGTFGAALSLVYAYNATNTAGHTKKVTINAMTLFTFALGNIVGTEIFLPKDAPAYIPGKIAIMVLLIAQLFITLLLRFINYRLNRQKAVKLAELIQAKGWTDEDVEREREKHAFLDMTDKENPFFVYTP